MMKKSIFISLSVFFAIAIGHLIIYKLKYFGDVGIFGFLLSVAYIVLGIVLMIFKQNKNIGAGVLISAAIIGFISLIIFFKYLSEFGRA
jgi:hypothetical protein